VILKLKDKVISVGRTSDV